MQRPYSQACENNKAAILKQLEQIFPKPVSILEIGSGTGQHALFFAAQCPQLVWQPSDRPEQLAALQLNLDEKNLPNLKDALALDLKEDHWPSFNQADPSDVGVFTANTLHIISWQELEVLFARIGKYLQLNGLFCSYGPFNIQGQYTSASNGRFDQWLKDRDPLSGVRDREELITLAEQHELSLKEQINMPANNLILVWEKV